MLAVKNPPANAGDERDAGSVPGSGRSSGVENGNPLQYSCLENPMDRGVCWATVHGVTKSSTHLKQLSIHAHMGGAGLGRESRGPWSSGVFRPSCEPGSLHKGGIDTTEYGRNHLENSQE